MPLLNKDFSIAVNLIVLLFSATLAQAECGVNDNQSGPLRIAVTGMPLLVPQQARVGALYGAEVRLPQLLVAGINIKGMHVALDYSHLDLRGLMRPGGLFSSQQAGYEGTLDRVELPAADFFLTGVIENIGLSSDEATSVINRYVDRSLALMDRRHNQPRQLSLVVELYASGTGELVMQRRYMSKANWSFPTGQALGIDSPKLWQADYGRELLSAVARVIADIEEAVPCTGAARVPGDL